jgi:molybdenum cofactor biosynthesis enzyme MoaA
MSKEEKQINVLLQQLNTIKNLKLTTKLKKKRKFFASLRATELMPPAEEADQRRAKELEKDEAKALKRQKAWKKQINRKRSKREGVARRKSASAS